MSSGNEGVEELKNKIIQCQEEVLQLLQENQRWPFALHLLEEEKRRAEGELRRQSDQISNFGKKLDDLYKDLKYQEEREIVVKATNDRIKNLIENQFREIEDEGRRSRYSVDNIEKLLSSTREKRVEMEKRLENLNVFCEAVYSTLKSKKS